jgi:hypothetical protein
MQHSPSWEANRSLASQLIPPILWIPKVHYRIQNRPPSLPISSQINPFYDSSAHFLQTQFNIILLASSFNINHLTPNGHFSSRTAPQVSAPYKAMLQM